MGCKFFTITVLLSSILTSCSPPGYPTRTVQAPFQLKDSNQNPQQDTMVSGLPYVCRFTQNSSHNSCISCNLKSTVLRCPSNLKTSTKKSSCRHNKRKLKCLIGREAININLTKPQELVCESQMIQLTEVVKSIAMKKLTDTDSQSSLNDILDFTKNHSSNICGIADNDALMELVNEFISLVPSESEEIKKSFGKVHKSRLNGELDSDSSRTLVIDLLSSYPQLKPVIEVVENLSFQGLESDF